MLTPRMGGTLWQATNNPVAINMISRLYMAHVEKAANRDSIIGLDLALYQLAQQILLNIKSLFVCLFEPCARFEAQPIGPR
jgi:hypothetical protein